MFEKSTQNTCKNQGEYFLFRPRDRHTSIKDDKSFDQIFDQGFDQGLAEEKKT